LFSDDGGKYRASVPVQRHQCHDDDGCAEEGCELRDEYDQYGQ
jgi:hypothetical protein